MAAPLRIMHISTRLILGGSQENTVLSCEGQARRGHALALVYGPIYGPEGSLYERVVSFRSDDDRAIETIETPRLVRDIAPLTDLGCVGDLRKIIRQWKPDVVHTHSSKAGIVGRIAAWRERVPCVIHTVHGPPFHKYERAWRNAAYIWAERYAARRCHRIVCVAQAMQDQFLAAHIGRPEQYCVIRSGMEVDAYITPPQAQTRNIVRARLGLREHDMVIGTVARLAEHKGHDDLLDALAPLCADRPSLKLLWVGDGWWRQRLMARAQQMNMADRIVMTGLVPPEDVPMYLHAMDLLAHPSYREGLPRTVTQAQLAGIATVAYDVDGTREVCLDRRTGLLVVPGDLDGLRAALRELIVDPDMRSAFALAGREFCRTRFSADLMVDQLLDLYYEVLNRP